MEEFDFTSLPDQRPLQPLSLGQALPQVMGLLKAHWRRLAELALLPILISFGLAGAFTLIGLGGPASFFILGVDLFLSVWFSVAVYRYWFIAAPSRRQDYIPAWRGRELRFFARGLGLFFMISGVVVLCLMAFGGFAGTPNGMPALGPGLVVGILAGLVVAVGFSFVLPAAALGTGYSFLRAVQEAKGILLPFCGLLLVTILPVDLGLSLVNFLLLSLEQGVGLSIPGIVFAAVANYVSLSVAATVLSVVFARRTGWPLRVERNAT